MINIKKILCKIGIHDWELCGEDNYLNEKYDLLTRNARCKRCNKKTVIYKNMGK